MTYINADHVFPENLLDEIRKIIPQGYIYVSPKAGRKSWGSANGVRQKYHDRNHAIREEYQNGIKVKELAEKYHLAENSIYHILKKSNTP